LSRIEIHGDPSFVWQGGHEGQDRGGVLGEEEGRGQRGGRGEDVEKRGGER